MPVIKNYNPRFDIGTGAIRSNKITPETLGAGAARQIGKAGAALTSIGETAYKHVEQQDFNDIGTKMSQARSDAAREMQEDYDNSELDNKEFAINFNEKLRNKLFDIEDSVVTTRGRAYYNKLADQTEREFSDSAWKHQADLAGMHTRNQEIKSTNNDQLTISNNPSSMYESTRQAGIERINNHNLPAKVREQMKLQYNAGAAHSAVDGKIRLAKSIPIGARRSAALEQVKQDVKGGMYKDHLDGAETNRALSRIDSALNQQAHQNKSLQNLKYKDIYKYTDKIGDPAPNIQNGSEDELADSLRKRIEWGQRVSNQYGVPYRKVPIFRDTDVESFNAQMDESNPTQQAGILRAYHDALPKEMYSKFSKQVYEGNPVHGISMITAPHDMVAAQKMQAGRKILAGDTVKGSASGQRGTVLPSAKDFSIEFDKNIGNSITNKEHKVPIREAVNALWAKTASDAGKPLDFVDPDDYKSAYDTIMGEAATVGDRSVLSFRRDIKDKDGNVTSSPFVPPNEIEKTAANMTSDQVMASQGDFPRVLSGDGSGELVDVNLEKSEGRISLFSVKDGTYNMQRDGDLLLDKNGKPFVLDMRKLMDYRSKNVKSLTDTVLDLFRSGEKK